ncbi:hypothetical protein Glo7428_4559 [Gloeocapsa sp. PCC 7428]|nr:hypothetical protein Glo7428_4559 [Gloeocapsa sp. PCC 7428]
MSNISIEKLEQKTDPPTYDPLSRIYKTPLSQLSAPTLQQFKIEA